MAAVAPSVVNDDGIGIRRHFMSQIFEDFIRQLININHHQLSVCYSID